MFKSHDKYDVLFVYAHFTNKCVFSYFISHFLYLIVLSSEMSISFQVFFHCLSSFLRAKSVAFVFILWWIKWARCANDYYNVKRRVYTEKNKITFHFTFKNNKLKSRCDMWWSWWRMVVIVRIFFAKYHTYFACFGLICVGNNFLWDGENDESGINKNNIHFDLPWLLPNSSLYVCMYVYLKEWKREKVNRFSRHTISINKNVVCVSTSLDHYYAPFRVTFLR